MVYLKTIFSTENEMKFLLLNLLESSQYIDQMLICEFDRTHVGEKRKFIFEECGGVNFFPEALRKKIRYLPMSLDGIIEIQETGDGQHKNEEYHRGYFVNIVSLNPWDIVISVDADEIIFKENYPLILQKLKRPFIGFPRSFLLPVRQFFYKINYLWEEYAFEGPIACHAGYFMKKYPASWRYQGKKLPGFFGAHFSWCMPVEEMVKKLNSYAHKSDYQHLADKAILERAIEERKYPFDPERDFRIKVLDPVIDKSFYPESLIHNMELFKEVTYG